MTESLKKFAKELKSFRESKEVSLQYIASRTKIDIKFLQAIEEGNFEILPDLYIRAFIKEYAQVADFDVTEVLKKYELARKGMIEDKSNQEKDTKEKESVSDIIPEQKRLSNEVMDPNDELVEENIKQKGPVVKNTLSNKPILYIVFGVIIILISTYFIFLGDEPKIEIETTSGELSRSTENRFEIEENLSQESIIPQDDSLKLALKASARVWVKILSDNKIVFQNIMSENEQITFKAEKEFRVSVGNAGLLTMELNNKQLKVPGSKGELRGYIINPDTVKSYILSVPSKNENRSPNTN
jgi:cytoskeletal protein RodZ